MALDALHGASAPTTATKAFLHEVFVSFQGEGILTGVRQLFVRLAGCDIRCPWCDTPDALTAKGMSTARIETRPAGPWREICNPVTPKETAELVLEIAARDGALRWVSLTGGEPAIWRRFLAALLPRLRAGGLKTYLETNGLHPGTVRALASELDFVSMDVKLPFADYPADPGVYAETAAAIEGAGQAKIVVTTRTPRPDIERAARMLAGAAPDLPLILQPVSRVPSVGARPPDAQTLLELQRAALRAVRDVRILGQLHKVVRVR